MTRQIKYRDSVQVTKATLDDVRSIAHNWHDPPNGKYFMRLQQAPTISNGTHPTDEQDQDGNEIGDPLYEVEIVAELHNVPDTDITAELQNLADAINANFPAEWPTVGTAEIRIN